jgi:hypothetical protein
MTTLVWREEVSADAPGKRVFSERCVLAEANRPLPALMEIPSTDTG